MSTESKFFIGIGAFTLILILVGVFFFSKQGTENTSSTPVDEAVLLANIKNSIGDPDSPIQIVEFADLQCPACKAAHPIVQSVLDEYSNEVFYVWRHYPLSIHKNAKVAAQAAEAAGRQDKFWQMANLLFEKQDEWADSSKPKEFFASYAQSLELDAERFEQDIEDSKNVVEQDFADGNKAGVQSTPTFFINGEKYQGVVQKTQFQELINQYITLE